MENVYQFDQSLAAEASVSAGGYGISFSASAGYKEMSSVLSNRKIIFLYSYLYSCLEWWNETTLNYFCDIIVFFRNIILQSIQILLEPVAALLLRITAVN